MVEQNPELAAALEQLEQRLETPIVPGELASWIEEVAPAWRRAESLLRLQVTTTHPKLLNEIMRQDQGLATRVAQLQQADAGLIRQMDDVRQIVDELRTTVDHLEPDEKLAEDATVNLVEKGLQVVIAARKQEVAMSTWYVEAFERDRGVVD